MSDKITCVIIDDEPGSIVTLRELLKIYCPDVKVEDTATHPLRGIELVRKVQPELVFLDIEMPQANAFDVLDQLSPVDFEVIFVTAFNDYAIKAFKYAALDYLLKPVNIIELQEAVQKAVMRAKEKNLNLRVASLLNNTKIENARKQKVALPTSEGFCFTDFNNIMHLQSEGSYTNVTIKGQKKELVSKSLKDFEELLPESIFCRIHNSYMININYVKKYYKGRGGYVEMEDGATYDIAVRKREDFFEKFMR